MVRTYREKVGSSYVVYKEMACIDPECQKKVEKTLKTEKDKRLRIKNEQDKREEERKARITNSRKSLS